MRRTSRDEMETTITFTRHGGLAEHDTADPAAARRWRRLGWSVAVLGRYLDGTPRTWQAAVPWTVTVPFGRYRGTDARAYAGSYAETRAGDQIRRADPLGQAQ